MKKNKFIIFLILAIIIVFIIIFYVMNNKKIEIGNNDNNQILNMNSYKAEIEVTVVSNKNTNKYKMTQEYKKGEYCMQEVEEPENIRGVRIEYSNNTLTLKNTNMDLTNIYENYKYMAENNLFLNEFIDDFSNYIGRYNGIYYQQIVKLKRISIK